MTSGIYWSIGQRGVNQDSLALYQVVKNRTCITFALVADGIGGLQEGEKASGFVAEQLVDWFYKEALSCGRMNQEYLVNSMNIRLEEICDQLRKYAEFKQLSLGTTCTAFLAFDRKFLMMHVGDCSAYTIKGRAVKKVTVPHVDKTGAVTKCIGSFGFYEPDYFVGTVSRKEAILLCSDGFWKLGELHFSETLRTTELDDTAMIERRLQMIGEANEKQGGKDNQSAIYIRW